MSRWRAKRAQIVSFAADIVGAALRPIATQGRSYRVTRQLGSVGQRRIHHLLQRFIVGLADRHQPAGIL